MITKNRNILFIFALFLIMLGLIITDDSLANWLDPSAAGKQLNALIQGSALFKSILFTFYKT